MDRHLLGSLDRTIPRLTDMSAVGGTSVTHLRHPQGDHGDTKKSITKATYIWYV